MRYFIDEEFIEDGKTIDLISIGIAAEDGRELYMQSCEFDPEKASDWVKEHVFTTLSVCAHISGDVRGLYVHKEGQCTFEAPARAITGLRGVKMSGGHLIGAHADCPWRTREQIKREILAFMDIEKYGKPELWGWCSAYDFVAFCQLFGTMMNLPKGYPHYMKDFQHALDERDIPDDQLPEQEDGLHNALADAQHLKRLWGYIVRNDCWQ